MITKRVATIPC